MRLRCQTQQSNAFETKELVSLKFMIKETAQFYAAQIASHYFSYLIQAYKPYILLSGSIHYLKLFFIKKN